MSVLIDIRMIVRQGYLPLAITNFENGIKDTRYPKTDVRRYLTVTQRRELSLAISRATHHRLMTWKGYSKVCKVIVDF